MNKNVRPVLLAMVLALSACGDGHTSVPVGVDRKAEILCSPYGGVYSIRFADYETMVSIKVKCRNGMYLERKFKYERTNWFKEFPEVKLNETANVDSTN